MINENFQLNPSEKTFKSTSLEGAVNFEVNETEILLSRLKNPIIKRQIAEIIFQERVDYCDILKKEEWEPFLPEGWTGEERFKLIKGKNTDKISTAEDLEMDLILHEPKSIEEIEEELDKDIEKVFSVTEIDFTTDGPNASVIPLNWIVPWTGERATPKQMSIIEAHEKGHRIRHYDSQTNKFRRGFDVSKVEFTIADYDILKQDAENHTNKPEASSLELTLVEMREIYLNEYLFTGSEIAERMSQLKNYFGFSGAEQFTKEHLSYAKENYAKDTSMDNAMSLFFAGITPETEDTFLELINNSGI